MFHNLLSINDLTDDEITGILDRARYFAANPGAAVSNCGAVKLIGLVFLQTSLRTQIGFAAACARLGWQTVAVKELRSSAVSAEESVEDTVRVISGITDLVVVRLPRPIASIVAGLPAPVINGGDAGPDAEHPTQALIDLLAIEEELGEIGKLHVAICGDLRLRASRSLLRLLTRRQPAKLSLISVPALSDGLFSKPSHFLPTSATLNDLADVDVLYVAGIPHQAIPENARDVLRVTAKAISSMPKSAIVLSPLPIIDEIDAAARSDARVRMFRQSDRGVPVRMAVLQALLAANISFVA